MTYVYKVVRVELDNTENYNNFIRSLSGSFRDRYVFSWMYAIIKLGIPKKANIVTPTQMIANFTKSRCDSAKFVKVEKIFLKAIAKSTYFATGGDDIYYYDITNHMKKKYDIKDFRYSSLYEYTFRYYFGEYVKPDKKIDLNTHIECGSGIHYVNSFEEAENFLKITVLQNYYNNVQEGKIDGIFSENGN